MNEEDAETRDEKTVSYLRDSGRNPQKVKYCEHQTITARREDSIQNEALIEIMLGRANMELAYRKVVSNKGAPGVDGMTTEDLKAHLQTNWQIIKEELMTGSDNHQRTPTTIERMDELFSVYGSRQYSKGTG